MPAAGAEARTVAPLRDVQDVFLRGLDPESDARAPIDRGLFSTPPSGSMEDRWAIYRDAYVVRITEAIANDYAAIARILGPAAFGALCRRYLAAQPPNSHDIGRVGERFAAYVSGDALTEQLPFLPDLARFEWALAVAVVSDDITPLRWDRLAERGPVALSEAPLRLAPATRLIRSDWPLHDLLLAKDTPDGEIDIELVGRPESVLVWRKGLEVRWQVVDGAEAALIEGARRGETLATLHDGGAFGTDVDAPGRAVAALRELVNHGAFAPLQQETP